MQALSDTSPDPADAAASVPEASRFSAPTRIVAAFGCVRAELGAEVSALGCRRVGVIADRGFADAGLLEPLLAAIDGVELPVCALIGEDPDVAEAERASVAAVDAGAEAILAVGGGSALCAAKAAAIRLTNPPPLDAYAGSGQLPHPPAPVIAVPTTAGSGSEVSNVVVLHDPRHTRHLVIRGHGYEPTVALLDGELLRSLPARPLVAAALDALSHALEALWVRGATRFTDAMALSAAATIRESLPWVLDGDDAARQALMEASAMANLACGNSGLGLVHALTSAPDVHLPHGYQNGVLLPAVARFNQPAVRSEVEHEIDRLDALYARIGFEPRFAPGELADDAVEAMVSAALANPFRRNNCRLAEETDLRAILAAVQS
jgi:alcohol dehydrogenase class IV